MATTGREPRAAARGTLTGKLDAAAWGVFFIWIGVVLLANLGWSVGLFGVGVITLGAQLARKYLGEELEGFWVLVGFLFLLGGIWELFSIRAGLVPILLIVAGALLLLSTLTARPKG